MIARHKVIYKPDYKTIPDVYSLHIIWWAASNDMFYRFFIINMVKNGLYAECNEWRWLNLDGNVALWMFNVEIQIWKMDGLQPESCL